MAARPKKPRYVVGIDLGTTNSAVAYAERARAKRAGTKAVKIFPIQQLVSAGACAARDMLPSSLYLPGAHELTPDSLRLPWSPDAPEPTWAVGLFAQAQGSRVAGRLVMSAKSWLSYGGVDRTAPILPWGASDVAKVSPIDASARFLEHLVHAWDHAFPSAPLAQQDVVLTVPASFDDVARTLTVDAARRVGLEERLVLLEEPQAAFYDYFRIHGKALTSARREQLVLVVDVGGGTTDFTLIKVQWTDDEEVRPEVSRIAIGDHILLGGDNMDLTVAHVAEQRITGRSGALDASSMGALVQSCRKAKEVLLGRAEDSPETYRVAIPGRGSRLVGGTQSCELTRADVEELVLDGFVPETVMGDHPARKGRSALSAWGLPYASDPAITKHIAAFLSRHGAARGVAVPDALLLNGGVFNSDAIRRRLVGVVRSWIEEGSDASLEVFAPETFDLAVARGAATYGLVRHGIGHRIGGGAARAYYVGVHRSKKESKKAAGRRGVCLLPRHVEPGETIALKDRVFQLVLGRPVRFSLFATTSDVDDAPGALVDLDDTTFIEMPPIETVLETQEDLTELPVTLRAELSEVGILEVYAQSVDRDARYRLEFGLRDAPSEEEQSSDQATPQKPAPVAEPLSPTHRDALEAIVRRTYGKARGDVDPREIKRVRHNFEMVIGKPRDEWTAPVCRAVWDLLKTGIRRRRRSERHEATFFHLTGFCLRPGFGDAFDNWRIGEMWKVYDPGVHFVKDAETWNAYWIMWRRIAGGLDEAIQARLVADLTPWLKPPPELRNQKKPKMQGREEALRLVGALERISPETKADWGDWFLNQLDDRETTGRPAWCLARLGARQPFYGSPHQVVSVPQASAWVERLLALDWGRINDAALAAATISRCTGDRARDLHPEIREAVAKRLEDISAMARWAHSVREVVALETKDESRVLGDTLPEGLKLL